MFKKFLLMAVVAGALCAGCGKSASSESSDDAFHMGWSYYRLTEFDLAQKYFEASMKLAKNDMQKIRALSSLADTWNYRAGNNDYYTRKAAVLYKRVVAEDTTGAWAPWAALALARQALWKQKVDDFANLAEMEEAYGAVIRDYPGTMAAEEAFLYLQNLRMARIDDEPLDESIAAMEAWVAQNPESPLLPRAYMMLARGYHLRREGVKYIATLDMGAKIELERGQNANIPQGDQAENYFKMGMAAQFDAGDFALARKYYGMLIEKYPTDQRVFIAEQHMDQMDEFEEKIRKELKAQVSTGKVQGSSEL